MEHHYFFVLFIIRCSRIKKLWKQKQKHVTWKRRKRRTGKEGSAKSLSLSYSLQCSAWLLFVLSDNNSIPENHLLLVQYFMKPRMALFLLVEPPQLCEYGLQEYSFAWQCLKFHVPTYKLNMYLKWWRIFIVCFSFFFCVRVDLNTKSIYRVTMVPFLSYRVLPLVLGTMTLGYINLVITFSGISVGSYRRRGCYLIDFLDSMELFT